MSYFAQAVEKALRAGWKPSQYLEYDNQAQMDGLIRYVSGYNANLALLDPAFWQALGKALGWEEWMDTGYRTTDETDIQDYSWRVQWHRIIDALSEGGTPETFFKDLLANDTV